MAARAENIENELSQAADDDWEEQAAESEGAKVLEEVGELTLDEIRQIKYALTHRIGASAAFAPAVAARLGRSV